MEEIEGFLCDETMAINFEKKFPERITYYSLDVNNDFGFAFKKDDETLLNEFNEFLKDVNFDKLYEKWNVEDDSKLSIEKDNYKGTKTIKAGFFCDGKPFCYIVDGEFKGYDIDLLYQFANSKNYNIELIELDNAADRMNLDEYDITGGTFTITEERAKTVQFSNPIFRVGTAFAVRTDSKKDKIKLSLFDDEYNEVPDNKASIKLEVGDNTLESKCTFPDIFNDILLLKCKISDLKDVDPYSEGVKSFETTDKLRILYSDLEINNLLKANDKVGGDIIKESDKSKAICSEENRAKENNFITRALLIAGSIGLFISIVAIVSLCLK